MWPPLDLGFRHEGSLGGWVHGVPGVWGAGYAGCWVHGVLGAHCSVQELLGVSGAECMGCWMHCMQGAGCAGCTGCWVRGVLGVWGAGAREGVQQHGVALPPLWGCWGTRRSGGADGHQLAARADGARRAHRSPRHAGGRWLFGDGHTSPARCPAPNRHPQPQLTAQVQHPPPCHPYQVAPRAEPGDGTSIARETRCQHRPGAAALPKQRKAPAGAVQPQLQQ